MDDSSIPPVDSTTDPSVARPNAVGCNAAVRPARSLVRWLYCHNPFYVISAWLVFSGLRASFDTGGESFATWALLGGLAVYCLLLAASACLLIRLGSVWDDIRTLVVLILLMFLAISVSLDDALAHDPQRGARWLWAGLAFAVVVSEGLLRGLRVRLPMGFRLPYYLLLSLFFVYPVALGPLLTSPNSRALQWALFGFPTAAGVAALTLLPAVRRGPGYVADNGTPWRWPMFPWTIFVVLGFAVCLRSYYLCLSLHFVGGSATIFGGYFLVPFLLAVNILLMETAIVSGRVGLQRLALSMPLLLLGLTFAGTRHEIVYATFLAEFVGTLGATPLYLTFIAAAVFYAVAAVRRVRWSLDAGCLALGCLACLGPKTVVGVDAPAFHAWPLWAAAAAQAWLAVRRGSSQRAFVAACALVAALTIDLRGTWFMVFNGWLPAHLMLAAALAIGATFHDDFARILRRLGAPLLFWAGLVGVAGYPPLPGPMPSVASGGYVLALAIVAACYGYWFGYRREYYTVAGLIAGSWMALIATQAYLWLRQRVAGLDQIAVGAVFFILALGISLLKVRAFERLARRLPWTHKA